MISPIETFIAVGLFMGTGLHDGKKFDNETDCLEYKEYLMEMWQENDLDKYVYYVMCRRDDA